MGMKGKPMTEIREILDNMLHEAFQPIKGFSNGKSLKDAGDEVSRCIDKADQAIKQKLAEGRREAVKQFDREVFALERIDERFGTWELTLNRVLVQRKSALEKLGIEEG
jgi:hypothetical protein